VSTWKPDYKAFRAVKTEFDLANVLGTSDKALRYFAYKGGKKYRSFCILKRSGGTRRIDEPVGPLKTIQRRLAVLLTAAYRPRASAFGFIEGRGIRDNALKHRFGRRPTWLLNIDLLDFFPSIHFGRVRGLLQAPPLSFPRPVAALIAALCTRRAGALPQGAPTSPVLSNMVCVRLDRELQAFCKARRIRYSRYVDDLSFSTSLQSGFSPDVAIFSERAKRRAEARVGADLETLIASNGFKVNPAKTRLFSPRARKEVTGLTVSSYGVNVRRDYVRDLRAMIHSYQLDPDMAEEAFATKFDPKRSTREAVPSLANVVQGRLAYLSMVKEVDDPVFCRLHNAWVRARGWGEPREVVIQSPQEWRRAIWRVEHLDGSMGGGTAFAVAGSQNLLVTAFHCMGDILSGSKVEIVKISCPELKLSGFATFLWGCGMQDVAILRANVWIPERLRFVPRFPAIQSKVWLCGYPELGTSITTPTRVRQVLAPIKTQRLVAVDTSIVEGMSGGPVIDDGATAVGVMVTGLTQKTLQQAAAGGSVQSAFVVPQFLPNLW
jgi:RNA-directed DNA polymerase